MVAPKATIEVETPEPKPDAQLPQEEIPCKLSGIEAVPTNDETAKAISIENIDTSSEKVLERVQTDDESDEEELEEDASFSCDNCWLTFDNKTELAEHAFDKHGIQNSKEMKAEESVLVSAATAMQETVAVLKSASTEVETSPTVQKTSPTVQKTSPIVQKTSPTVQKTCPTVQESSPPVQESSPTAQETNPTVQETNPTVQETSPTVQETYLTEIDVDQLEAVWKPSTAVVLKNIQLLHKESSQTYQQLWNRRQNFWLLMTNIVALILTILLVLSCA